jgi:hypothetical protein
MRLSKKISDWWKGPESDLYEWVGRFSPKPSAMLIQRKLRWLKKEYKWWVTTLIAIIGLIIYMHH